VARDIGPGALARASQRQREVLIDVVDFVERNTDGWLEAEPSAARPLSFRVV